MSWGIVAGAAVGLVGSAMSADAQRSAGNKASDAQVRAAQMDVEERRRQFDAIQKLLSPFVTGGASAFGQMGDLAGTNGADKQQAAIAAIQASPEFGALTKQGENAILANASATGGLRGGNVQGALGQFRPQLLAQLIDQQYSRLGGMASLGQNAAAGVGNAGLATANGIGAALQGMGAARAGAALSGGLANTQLINGFANAAGQIMGGFGGNANWQNVFTGDPGRTSVDWGF